MAFVLVSLSLRIVSAIAAAALLTAKFAIAMEEYSSEELSTVAVCINCLLLTCFFKLSISSSLIFIPLCAYKVEHPKIQSPRGSLLAKDEGWGPLSFSTHVRSLVKG